MLKPVITSVHNDLVKKTHSLHQKKYRKELGQYLCEGENIISNIPNQLPIEYYIVRENENTTIDFREGVDVYPVTDAVFKKISDTVTPQGLIAVIKMTPPKIFGGNCLILDRISDAGNMGAIIRTAAAFGWRDIFCINCTDAYAPKAVRSSMGGIFFTNIIAASPDVLHDLKRRDFSLISADIKGENISQLSHINKPTALIIGSEAHGVDSGLLHQCDKIVSIPITNVESLNASVAAGILMYAIDSKKQ